METAYPKKTAPGIAPAKPIERDREDWISGSKTGINILSA